MYSIILCYLYNNKNNREYRLNFSISAFSNGKYLSSYSNGEFMGLIGVSSVYKCIWNFKINEWSCAISKNYYQIDTTTTNYRNVIWGYNCL